MRFRTLAFGMFLVGALAADASAQTCLGLPSFSQGPYQAYGGAAFTDGAQGFAAGLSLGSDDVFGGGTFGVTNYSDIDDSSMSFAANAGATFVVNAAERIEACPVASVIISSGPDAADVDVSGVGLRFGGRLGIVAAEAGNTDIVPTFGLDIAYDRLTAEAGDVETTLSRETYAIVRVGVGFVLNDRIGVLPSLGVPLGLDGGDPEFSILVSYNFGRR